MSDYGLKIRNIKAGTLFGHSQGVRTHYDYTGAMFSNSLFSDYIRSQGMNVWNQEKTRDIICLDFDFGSRSYEEEKEHLIKQFGNYEDNKDITEESKEKIRYILQTVEANKENYIKMSKEDIRELFYENGVEITYHNSQDPEETQTIKYRMLYRNASKAKVGQVMFINQELYQKADDWLTMGLRSKMPYDNAKIVEMSAYAPLTTSTIVGKMHIPVEDILILKDQDSFFETAAKIVQAEEYLKQVKILDEEKTEINRQKAITNRNFLKNGSPKYRKVYKVVDVPTKKCVVVDENTEVKNTMWDGLALIEVEILPEWINGMALLRNHFFKACAFKSRIQLFFQDWCKENGHDYELYEVEDMFGIKHKLKDIKMITTNNAIKWIKFSNLMGNNLTEAYQYWMDRVNADGSYFGIVKTDHPSKLDDVQQMSYQMVNTLPCNEQDIQQLAETSVSYVTKLKQNNEAFETFLRRNANDVNHYEMMADLYNHNHDFAQSVWFKTEKSKILNEYVGKLKTGKITVNADNLTLCGNPYALLLYSVGEDWSKDPTLNEESGTIQCYTTRFEHNEYLCGIRNPHNSPNNICYLHNVHSDLMARYFPFSANIMAVNCIHTDLQDRLNGADFDSDFCFVTNNEVMVKGAQNAYANYPTIVNRLKESGVTYKNAPSEYARMDNKFAKSRIGIGESSNLAMLALTYYWTEPSKELYDNFVILSVLAQIIIDGCKREYEVDGIEEIKRIKKMPCMQRFIEVTDEYGKTKKQKVDFPEFMKFTRKIKHTKNGKELPKELIQKDKDRLLSRIDKQLRCPMNDLQIALNNVKYADRSISIPTGNFFLYIPGKANDRQMSKIRKLVEEYNVKIKEITNANMLDEDKMIFIKQINEDIVGKLKKFRIGNKKTLNRLIETALGIEANMNGKIFQCGQYTKTMRITLKLLYRMDKEKFLSNFISQ